MSGRIALDTSAQINIINEFHKYKYIYIYIYLYNNIYLKNSLIIQEQNTKKNHKRVVVLYVIKNHVNLHKL